MNWQNVKLIFTREMRDQLRDRRTLVLIAVVPVLLYPLMGMTIFQLTQFLRNEAAQVQVVGAEELAGLEWLPRLFYEDSFEPKLFDSPIERKNLQIASQEKTEAGQSAEPVTLEQARQQLAGGDVQIVLYFPPGFGDRLKQARQALLDRGRDPASRTASSLPRPQIIYKSTNEKSRLAHLRVEHVMARWRSQVMKTNLKDSNVPLDATKPFELKSEDVSKQEQRTAAMWSKILPFLLFVWALTGAFYPAVDVCAGEKERGTLETLLTSPAQRREIAWGKLLTVMTFSIVTALMNLASLGVTGMFVIDKLNQVPDLMGKGALSLPPVSSLFWLALALLPVAALFSALCLAFAAFARSTKEGQYYLMPLLVVIMPLMFLTMAPGVELTLGNSLIPVTGIVLLLRSIIEGQFMQVWTYAVPVIGVTMMCCLLAIRWVEELFNRESVMFRESERLDLGRWLLHLVRDRRETPTFAQGMLCIALIMVIQFFVNFAATANDPQELDFGFFARMVFISQVVCIALPALLLTLLFVKKPFKTLLLDRLPKRSHVGVAIALALLAVPLGLQFNIYVQQLYPAPTDVTQQAEQLNEVILGNQYFWMPYLLIALLPAVCEEITFRGFILSGLRHSGHKWWAIGITAVAFGIVHFFLQQKISAIALGMLIGYLAVQTSSIIPCIIFHAIYNGMMITFGRLTEAVINDYSLGWLMSSDEQWALNPVVLLGCLGGVAALCWYLHRMPYERTAEEQLHEVRERQLVGV